MSETVLETSGLTKRFRGRTAVDDLTLTVMAGDVYGFLGPNGAGKSTTIRMLTGLVRPTSGTARLLGRDIRSRRVAASREVGALVESPAFYRYLSARENLTIFSELSGGCEKYRIDEVLEIVGLSDRADDKVRVFSHGMLQRLGIAQSLLPNPRLVILDEPTTGLDPQGMRDVRDLIQRLSREKKVTIVLSSHLLHEVEQVCSRVGIINRGRLVAEGAVDELIRREEEQVRFEVDDPRGAEHAALGIEGVTVLGVGDDEIVVRAKRESVPEINRALVAASIRVSAVVPKQDSLEDLFLKLTGEAT